MDINKAETPEDEREISLNETSLKKPLDAVDVIGGHGPWQFRQWIVFFAASLCSSVVAFSALFLPTQTFCPLSNSTGIPSGLASLLETNSTGTLPEARNYVMHNSSLTSENFENICNSTGCNTNINVSNSDILSSTVFSEGECWNSQVETFAKCSYVVACLLSGILVYLSTDRFGRRPAALLSSIILIASSLATAWANTAATFLILRFLTSLGVVNIHLISAFSLMEYVHADFKLLYFLTGHLGWGMAHFILPTAAWLAEDWKSFNIILSVIGILLSVFVWFSPEFPSSFPNGSELTRTRKALKYAAFTNGYSTTDVDLLSHNFRQQENKHDLGTLSSAKAKILCVLYSSFLFFISFTTAFLYFAAKWHAEWFKVHEGRISFSFLGTTEVASIIILLFLTCFVAIKYLWAIVSAVSSALMIVIFFRTKEGSSTSSALLYTGAVFFTAAAWTLVATKCICHKTCSISSKFNLILTGVAVFAGTLVASAVVLKADNQDLLLVLGVLHFFFSICTVFLPEKFFGTIA